MMASLRVKSLRDLVEFRDCGLGHGGGGLRRRRRNGFVNYTHYDSNRLQRRIFSRAPRLVVVNRNFRSDWDSGASSSSVFDHGSSKLGLLATSITGDHNRERRNGDDDDNIDIDVAGKLDLWVKESVVEILNNLEEAPFLVHIYSDGKEVSGPGSTSSGKTRLVREKATAESWPLIKGRWGGGNPMPTGILLVEEIKNNEDSASSPNGENSGSSVSETCSSTKVWGLLIQGKGLSCPACYILKTCRVRSVLGCCTHFCLVRVECFFESVDIQLKKLWLV